MFPRKKIQEPWEGRMEPFRILGNLYFIGTYQASSHLIDTSEGLILIDTGYAKTLYLVLDSIYRLGFRPDDIKYIVNTHWHGDHAEASRPLAELSGAKNVIGKKDAQKVTRFFEPDVLVGEGDTLTLGNTTISFMETPGHTKGTVSLFFDVQEDGKTYRAGMFGGAGANTLAKGRFDYDGCREDYRASLHRLQKERVDVCLGNHTWNNDTEGKSMQLRRGEGNPFIDPSCWNQFLSHCESRLDKLIAEEAESEQS